MQYHAVFLFAWLHSVWQSLPSMLLQMALLFLSMAGPQVGSSEEPTCHCRRCRIDPKFRKVPWRREMETPSQYSCLENSLDRGVWWATVHGTVVWIGTLSAHHRYSSRHVSASSCPSPPLTRMFRVAPCPGSCEPCCSEPGGAGFLSDHSFSTHTPRRGSLNHGSSMFSFSRNLSYFP